eukprot:scaffold124315_cov19-Tisochrysis_lutea.AAC.2
MQEHTSNLPTYGLVEGCVQWKQKLLERAARAGMALNDMMLETPGEYFHQDSGEADCADTFHLGSHAPAAIHKALP